MPAGKCVRGMLAQRNKTTYCWYRFHTILDLLYWKGEWRNNGKLLCTYLSSSNTKTVIKEERRVLNNTSNRTSAGNFPEDESHGVDVGPLERLKMLHVYWIVKHFWGHIPVERHQVIIFDEAKQNHNSEIWWYKSKVFLKVQCSFTKGWKNALEKERKQLVSR